MVNMEMWKESFPIYDNNTENFLRPESDGRYSMILFSRPEYSLISLNKTAKNILDLCDGKHSMNDIVSFLCRSYEGGEESLVVDDVDRTVHLLWRMGAVSFKENDLYAKKYMKTVNGVLFRYLHENEAKVFCNTKLKKGVINPYIDVNAEYTPVEIGARWFNGSESFVTASQSGIDVVRMAIRLNPFLKVYDIAMLTYESLDELKDIFPDLINFLHNNYVENLGFDLFDGENPMVQLNCSCDGIFDCIFNRIGVLFHEINNEPVYLYEYALT